MLTTMAVVNGLPFSQLPGFICHIHRADREEAQPGRLPGEMCKPPDIDCAHDQPGDPLGSGRAG